MRRLLPVLMAVLAIAAGCSEDHGIGARVARLSAGADIPADTAPAGKTAHFASVSTAERTFARSPDHGDLLAYPSQRVVRRQGAYTWYRSDLSEAHALRAINGQLTLTAPSGEILKYTYQRHVEHPSGDWTWVGNLNGEAGEEALITFGARAAFGAIGQGGGRPPLRLTIHDGASWLVETDAAAIAQMDSPATRPRRPDFLVPPELAGGLEASSTTPGISSATTEATTAPAGASVVDVVLG
ncbi:MAG: hypothetical protein LC715_03215, partial [Gammaproteobacteria bacterium]|nr:hypothetical protein [Gammaproteobacteria bacterium]